MRTFIFIHINKTGGSSVAHALGLPMQMHATALEIKNHIPDIQWYSAFKFSIIRNPWDKVVSHYHYRVQTNQTGLADGKVDFNEWVRRAYGMKDPVYFDNPRYFMPQIAWLADQAGNIIIDHVGRYENIESEFAKICQIIGTKRALPHIRRSKHGHYREYYTVETKRIISDWFAHDIETFSYRY